MRHNPYFNRWISAIPFIPFFPKISTSHNPYFSRWFSAIKEGRVVDIILSGVTILILVDGFLQ